MTLTRRLALFIAGLLLLALGGALVIQTLGAQAVLQQQLELRNRDAAAALALALSQQKGELTAMQTVAAAQFDLGHYRSIVLTSPTGEDRIRLAQAAVAAKVPAWFARLLPLEAAPGKAIVSAGWTELGTLTVAAQAAWAQQALWSASTRTAGLLAALALLAAAVSSALLRLWLRPLRATVGQAQALEQGRFVQAPLPALPELRDLTRSMNTTVRRLREMFATQAQQVAYLQRRAQLDSLTALPQRQHFVQALARRLAQQEGLGLALVLVRVTPLAKVNQQQGRDMADALLCRVAGVLNAHLQQEPDSLGGRLSGGDFALCLPMPGMAADLAPGLWRAVRDAAAQVTTLAQVHLAALEGVTGPTAEAVLVTAGWSLARAESNPSGLQLEPTGPGATAFANLAAWQAQISSALREQRVRLGEFEVRDAQGGLIHLECPLRLQLDPHGAFQPAGRWLPMARRCGLMAQLDQVAIEQVLQAINADQRPRAVNVALASLSEPGLVAAIAARLKAQPEAARRLSVEWVDPGSRGDWQAAAQAIAAWQVHGVRMGVEHAGAAPEQLAGLRDLGLDYVKVDGLHLRGAASDATVNAYARSLVGLVQLLGLKALAEGVDQADDLQALWQLGFDGATGRALGNPPVAPAAAHDPTQAADAIAGEAAALP